MTEQYGTNLAGLAGFEGDLTADSGETLITNDSDGGGALLFGPAALREIQAGVANGDFASAPDDPDTDISEDNPLPYFSFTDNSGGAIKARVIEDLTAGSGNVLRVTVGSGTTSGNSITLDRFVPVPGTRNRSFVFTPEVYCVNAQSTSSAQVTISYQYYENDQTTTTGTGDSKTESFSTIGSASTLRITTNFTRLAIPSAAAYLKISITVETTGTVSPSRYVDFAEIRLVSGGSDLYIAENTAPGTYGPARIRQANGTLTIAPNLGGAGTVVIDGTLNLGATTFSSLTVSGTAGSTSIGVTNGNIFASNGIVRSERASAGNNSFEATVTGDSTTRFAIDADGAMEWGGGSAARDVNLYRSSSTTLRTDDAFAADFLSATLSVTAGNGNFIANGPNTNATSPTTSGRGAVWTLISGTNYRLERYVAASTQEVKKNIQPTTVTPQQLYDLELVDFEFDQDKIVAMRQQYQNLPDAAPGIQHGVIWEQVQPVIPHAAVPGNEGGDPPSIDWEALYFAALVAIQDLNTRLTALENE